MSDKDEYLANYKFKVMIYNKLRLRKYFYLAKQARLDNKNKLYWYYISCIAACRKDMKEYQQ